MSSFNKQAQRTGKTLPHNALKKPTADVSIAPIYSHTFYQ